MPGIPDAWLHRLSLQQELLRSLCCLHGLLPAWVDAALHELVSLYHLRVRQGWACNVDLRSFDTHCTKHGTRLLAVSAECVLQDVIVVSRVDAPYPLFVREAVLRRSSLSLFMCGMGKGFVLVSCSGRPAEEGGVGLLVQACL
jgi:hypothetical protein